VPEAEVVLAEVMHPYARNRVDISSYTTVIMLRTSPGDAGRRKNQNGTVKLCTSDIIQYVCRALG
jgi:hypothetical protein